ncbi:MAG: sugar phosphate isomerase/epimerase [Planctomycetes bacterium]|nr:sugar phosphate isomerase/epimerase [Planctomycetota bacterium]
MKFGVCSFVYRWSMGRPYYQPKKPLTCLDFLAKMHQYGVKGVLLCNNIPLHEYSDAQLNEVKTRLDEYGMFIELGSRGTTVEYFVRMLDICNRLGAKVLRVVYDIDRSGGEDTVPAQVEAGIDCLIQVVPEAKKRGVVMGIENGHTISIAEVKTMIEKIGDDTVGSVPDTLNSASMLEKPEAVFRLLAPYAKQVHYKDFIMNITKHGTIIEGVAMGDGIVDFPKMTGILNEIGYQGNIFLELYVDQRGSEEETFAYEDESVRRSLAYAKQLGLM